LNPNGPPGNNENLVERFEVQAFACYWGAGG
jgi:hypothetical protein